MWMDLEIIIPSEVKSEKNKYHMISLTCGILKNDTNELIYKTKTDSQTSKTNLWLPKWKSGERDKLGVGINIYTLLYIKQIIKKDLLYSTGNYIQYLV